MNIAALFDLAGKTAPAAGGSSGIGEVLARNLGLAGAKLFRAAKKENVPDGREISRRGNRGIESDFLRLQVLYKI